MDSTTFFLVLCSSLIHALWNFAARTTKGNLPVLWIAVSTASVLLPLITIPLDTSLRDFLDINNPTLILILLSGLIHGIYYLILFKAYEEGEISTVYPIARGTSVLIASIGGVVLLGDKLSGRGALGICSVISGIIFIGLSSSKKNTIELHSLKLAIVVGVLSAGYSLVDAFAVKNFNPILFLIAFFPVSALVMFPFTYKALRQEDLRVIRKHSKALLCVALGIPAAYVFILVAFQTGVVGYISSVREMSVVIGALLGFLMLKEQVSRRKVIGILAIVLGALLIKLA